MDDHGTQENTGIVLQVQPVTAVIGPLGFHGYASEFLRAAHAFETDRRFSPVPYYLVCRSLELVLKAYLLGRGVGIKTLKRRVGHNLVKALGRARALGIDGFVAITKEHEREFQLANGYYESKGFEYFNVHDAAGGYKNLPDLSVLEDVSSNLIESLESFCLEVT